MNEGYDRQSAARQELEWLCADLVRVSARLEELGTLWRRDHHAESTAQELPLTFPARLQTSAQRLAETLRALVAAGPGQPPDLAFSAMAQLAALHGDVAAAADDGYGPFGGKPGDTPGGAVWASIEHTLEGVGKRLWSLISHLVTIKEWSWSEQASTGLLGINQARVSVTFAHVPGG